MAKRRDDYTAANRAAWEASAPYHEEGAEFAALLAGFREAGFQRFDTDARINQNRYCSGFDLHHTKCNGRYDDCCVLCH